MDEAAILRWVWAGVETLIEMGVKMGAKRDAVLDGVDAGLKLARKKTDDDLAKKHPGHGG